MYVCMHACMVCMYAWCMYACMHVCMYACMYVCIYIYIYKCIYIYVCMYVYMYIFIYSHMYVYLCMHVCMYTNVYVCFCSHVHTITHNRMDHNGEPCFDSHWSTMQYGEPSGNVLGIWFPPAKIVCIWSLVYWYILFIARAVRVGRHLLRPLQLLILTGKTSEVFFLG